MPAERFLRHTVIVPHDQYPEPFHGTRAIADRLTLEEVVGILAHAMMNDDRYTGLEFPDIPGVEIIDQLPGSTELRVTRILGITMDDLHISF